MRYPLHCSFEVCIRVFVLLPTHHCAGTSVLAWQQDMVSSAACHPVNALDAVHLVLCEARCANMDHVVTWQAHHLTEAVQAVLLTTARLLLKTDLFVMPARRFDVF